MKILLVNNHDSFVYNIAELVRLSKYNIDLDIVNIEDLYSGKKFMLRQEQYIGAILSPGPGVPNELTNLNNFINDFHTKLPILGICLGHQAICEYFGAKLIRLEQPLHGDQSPLNICDTEDQILKNIKTSIIDPIVGLYHSWAVDIGSVDRTKLIVSSVDKRGIIMSVSHIEFPIIGLQFHPEAIATNCGEPIMNNFMKIAIDYNSRI